LLPLIIDDPVRHFHLLIEEFHIGKLNALAFIHPVDEHALSSSSQKAVAQSEKLGFLRERESFAIPGIQIDGGAVQKKGNVFAFVEQEVAEPERVPFDLGIIARQDKKYFHSRFSELFSIKLSDQKLYVKAPGQFMNEVPVKSASRIPFRSFLTLFSYLGLSFFKKRSWAIFAPRVQGMERKEGLPPSGGSSASPQPRLNIKVNIIYIMGQIIRQAGRGKRPLAPARARPSGLWPQSRRSFRGQLTKREKSYAKLLQVS
jgi:hypothetical protein